MLKTQLAIAINFISSKGNDEECVMHSKSYNTEFMIYDNADEVIFFNHFFLDLDWIGNINERQ